jgi:hypothetical protein
MRRTILLMATMALTLMVASGVALAITKIGTDGHDTLLGTKGPDVLSGRGGTDSVDGLVLRSSKVVHKSASPMPRRFRRTTPHPGSCSMVELLGSYPRGQIDLLHIGEALSCQCFSSKQSPPRFLEVEPARPYGYEDLLHPRVVLQPLSDGWTLVARKVVGDQVKVADGGRFGNRFQ